jgi:glycosyltransferase involved in cell wall biosynthesis
MPATRRSVTLFYPMYNEVKSVQPMTHKALEVMRSVADDFEILIIDDGSSDGSEKIADELAQSDPHIRVIHHQGNQGYGQALRTGFASATKDFVVYTDADEPADLRLIGGALEHLIDYDMVIGYRLQRWEGWKRFIFSKVYNFLVTVLFGVRVHDINFSFKLFHRVQLQQFRLGAGSAFIDGELLAEAARYGLTIFEMPVEYLPRKFGESKFNSMRAALYTLEEIVAYARRRHAEGKTAIVASANRN